MKRILALALALIIALSTAACGGTAGSEDSGTASNSNPVVDLPGVEVAENERYVSIGIDTDPISLGPWSTENVGRKQILYNFYQVLTPVMVDSVTGEMTEYAGLASGYERINETTYEVYLREGIYDTNQYPLTASDVVFSINTCIEMGENGKAKTISSAEALDDYTIRITFNNALASGDFCNALATIFIVTQKSYEESPDKMITTPVGTSGYVLKEYVTGSHFTMTRADTEYWNQAANDSKSVEDGYLALYDTNNVDTVTWYFITDKTTMAMALESETIDISASINSSDISLFRDGGTAADQFDVAVFPNQMEFLCFNGTSSSPASNYNFRMAIAHGFNSADLLDAGYGEDGIVLTAWATPYVGNGYQDEWTDRDYFNYDRDLAMEYLEKYYQETGTTAADVHIKLLVTNKPAYVSEAQVLQAYIMDLVGTTNCCELVSLESNTYTSYLTDPTTFDIVMCNAVAESTYLTLPWANWILPAKNGTDYPLTFVDDMELVDMLLTAQNPATFSDETVSALMNHIDENCYLVGTICGATYMVGASWCGNIMRGPRSCVMVCGLEYDWAAK